MLLVPNLTITLLYVTHLTVLSRLCDEKCEEYSKAVYVTQESPVLSRRSRTESVSECGIVSVPLVVGGTKANKKEFPHMVQIGFESDDDIVWDCGGTLISESYVLTAAHCLSSRDKGEASNIKLGATQTKDNDEDEEQVRGVKRRIPHPEYKKPSKYHDIALIEMDEPVEFTAYVRPACISATDQPGIKKAIAIGFGKLEYGAQAGSNSLMKVVLDVLNMGECKKVYEKELISFNHGLDATQLCVGVLAGGKDTCQGDSGGPLQIVMSEPYCMYNVIGVTSTGLFCGYANAPAIYTKVSKYVDWIESVVW